MNIGIIGYGNVGRGVETALAASPDLTLYGIFTRRNPETVHPISCVPVYALEELESHAPNLDAVIACGGSATDLPEMTASLAKICNVVDSFDTHAKIPEHFARVEEAAAQTGHTAVICGGWDPGLFSLIRSYAAAVLPAGESYTFWGRGVSQGHSDAIRRIPGVADARQYTVPIPSALEQVRRGENPELTPRQKHLRECYVVAREGADREAIRQAIVTMPNYFADYDTTVTFLSQEEMDRDHREMPHGGSVIRSGVTGKEHRQVMEFSLNLDSNPEFTGSVLVALARAAVRLNRKGETGCKTMLDIAPGELSPLSPEELRRTLL